MRENIRDLFPPSPVGRAGSAPLEGLLANDPAMLNLFQNESLDGFLLTRQVTCHHCGGEAPPLKNHWLSKVDSDPWGMRVVPENGKVRFETYRVKHGRGPHGEDPNMATVNRGIGQCVHCKQAIDGDEIKRQARGESPHGAWKDRLYAVVAVRSEPKLDARGLPLRYSSGARKGEIKTTKIRYFRSPNERNLEALVESERRLAER